MPPVQINPGEAQVLVNEGESMEYYVELLGEDVRLGRSKSDARAGGERRGIAGDRGPMGATVGEEIWAFVEDTAEQAAEVFLSPTGRRERSDNKDGFYWDREPRSTVGSVWSQRNNDAAPASDDFAWPHSIGYPLHDGTSASDATESFQCPDRADFVVVHADDATGSFSASVAFEDPDGNTITEVTKADDSELSGSASDPVMARVAVASPYVTVTLTDESGASNTVDYSIYGR